MGVLPETVDESRAAAHAAQRPACMVAEFSEITRAEIGQFVMFPVAPDVLYRIELRRVARQLLDREPAILGRDEFA